MNIDDISMHLEIGQALSRYCHGCDHGDLELGQSAYWPEATDQHGNAWNGNGPDFMTSMQNGQEAARADGFPAVGGMHNLTTTLIERISPTHAKVQSYFVVWQPYLNDGQYHVGQMVGRYLDVFE